MNAGRPLAAMLLAAMLLASGCSKPVARAAALEPGATRTGAIERWGTMKEALREGRTQGRVDLAEFVGRRDVVAVGALEDLAGEITIVDGEVWIARAAGPHEVETTRVGRAGERATMLFAARVDDWVQVVFGHAIAPGELEREIRSAARAFGFDLEAGVPFVIQGELADLELHVVAGECPVRAAQLGRETTRAPFHLAAERRPGKLVGFYVENAGGVLTHMGSNTHMHALLPGEPPLTGHVDSVGLAPGAQLRLPMPPMPPVPPVPPVTARPQ